MKYIKYCFLVIILLINTSILSFSQNETNSKIGEADKLVQEKKYDKAESLYKEILKENPSLNLVTYKLASLYQSTGKYKLAIENYLKLAPNGNPTVLYNLACAYSRLGKKTEAFNALEKSIAKGFTQVSLAKTDPDLENIRGNEKFDKLLKSIKSLENFPESKKFDFWVGEWNVFNPQNQKAGESKIEKILKGAVILENWTGRNNFMGKSFNHYNMDKKKWVQYWVNQNSGSTFFEGNYDEGQKAIVYFSHDHEKDENGYIERLRFFNLGPNKVRQFAERSTDNGKTWSTEYDLTYIRKEK